MLYALVPVRVPIEANSAVEICRAQELVRGIVAASLDDRVRVRLPTDPIYVIRTSEEE